MKKGDIVQLSSLTGPLMVVVETRVADHTQTPVVEREGACKCVFWNENASKFEFAVFEEVVLTIAGVLKPSNKTFRDHLVDAISTARPLED